MEESLRTSMSSWSMESMIPRHQSMEEHLVDGRHHRRNSSSSRRRSCGLIVADDHRCRSNHIIDQEQESINDINDDDDDPAAHHEYCHCQYHPANNSIINEAVPDELDFRDVFGGPPRSTTNILLRRCGFSGDFGTTTTASAGGSRSVTNFYDEIFCPPLRASHHHHHHHHHHHPCYDHQSDPDDPNSRHGDPGGGRSALGDGCFLHSRARMRNNRKPVRFGRLNLPGFDIPSSSFSFSWAAEEEMRRTPGEKEAGFYVKTEEGFYDDIFRSSSNDINGSGGDRRLMRSSRTCNSMLSKSAKSRSKSKSKASVASSASVLSSDQDALVTSPPSHVIRSSIHQENSMTMPTSTSAAHRHRGRHKEEEDVIFSSFVSKLRPITIPNRSTCRSSRGYDSSPAPSSILSAEEEDDVNVESSCSQGTSLITIKPLSATTFTDLCSTSSSPPLPPSSDYLVKKSSVNSNLFQHCHYWNHDQLNSSTNTQSTAAAILFSDGLTKPRPAPSAFATGGRNTSTTIHVANGTAADDACNYTPRSPSSVVSSVFLEPLPTNAAHAPAHDERITEKKVLLAQEEVDHEIGACDSDQNDSESSFIKDIEYINRRASTHAMTIMMGDTEGATAVDEAIAWAKEKFWNGSGPAAGV